MNDLIADDQDSDSSSDRESDTGKDQAGETIYVRSDNQDKKPDLDFRSDRDREESPQNDIEYISNSEDRINEELNEEQMFSSSEEGEEDNSTFDIGEVHNVAPILMSEVMTDTKKSVPVSFREQTSDGLKS